MFWSILTLSILVKFNYKVCLAIKPVLIITLLLVIANSSEYIAIIGEKNKVKNAFVLKNIIQWYDVEYAITSP